MREMIMLRSVKDADVRGLRIVVRLDLNVPIKDGKVVDDLRIRAVVPTLLSLQERGAQSITLLSHLGRPNGKKDERFSLAPVEARLRELTKVPFTMHENVRFDPREETNDSEFARELAGLGDIFVNDAFAASHRAHASIVGVAKLLPSFAGLHLEDEVAHLLQALAPEKPSLAIIGGAKFETKEPLLQKLLATYDEVLVGGALGNDLLKARGLPVGASLVAGVIAPTSLAGEVRLLPPVDLIVAGGEGMQAGVARTANTGDVRASEKIVDIGPQTAKIWSEKINHAQFVLWNGPMGIYEEGHTQGTDALAAMITGASCRAIIGGGDTIASIMKHVFDKERVFLSTGGGAMLQFLTDGTLPGIEVLKK